MVRVKEELWVVERRRRRAELRSFILFKLKIVGFSVV